MLDVFVVALLTAVVQLGQFARVAPGPAVLPFAGVVILTMLASASFDARTIWDRGVRG
jgi:paraquat-inducible protein A